MCERETLSTRNASAASRSSFFSVFQSKARSPQQYMPRRLAPVSSTEQLPLASPHAGVDEIGPRGDVHP